MKVAVCVSGLVRGEVEECLESHAKHFSQFDTFYSTWEDLSYYKHKEKQRNIYDIVPDAKCFFAPEPKLSYHPAIDAKINKFRPDVAAYLAPLFKNKAQRSRRFMQVGSTDKITHQTKQILAHAHLLSNIPEEYDMIIRTRFDVRLSPNVDFTPLLERSYKENIAIGCNDPLGSNRNFRFDVLAVNKHLRCYVSDFLMFHPRKLFDVEKAWDLHNNGELLPGEYGWYQLLSYPYGDTHINITGGAVLNRLYRKGKYT